MTALIPTTPVTLPRFELASDAQTRIQAALELAECVSSVATPQQNEFAATAQREVRLLLSEIETARDALKRPILDLGRAIDAKAKEVRAPLETERDRIGLLCANYLAEEREKERARIQEIERKAREERERIEREQREAEARARAAQEAAERSAREQRERELAAARNEQERQEAEARAAKAAEIAAKAAELDRIAAEERAKDAQRIADERAAVDRQIAAAPKATGQTVKEDWEINIVNLWDLARAHPACVKIEARLSEIRALLDAGVTRIPGVTARKVTVVHQRAGKVVEV